MDFFKNLKDKKNILNLRSDFTSEDQLKLESYISKNKIQNRLFLSSSGSSGIKKVFEFKNEDMLGHAEKINEIFNIGSSSTYLNVLPHFYMGGASIFYRTFQAKCRMLEIKWEPLAVINTIKHHRVTHLSLVPTQVFDLVANLTGKLDTLKCIFVGGDYLTSSLRQRCLDLELPIIETYGASEFCSQVASSIYDGGVKCLDFCKIKTIDEKIFIKTPFHYQNKIEIGADFFKVYAYHADSEGFFETNDLGEFNETNKRLVILGRSDDLIKKNGKFISTKAIESRLFEEIGETQKVFITFRKSERSGVEVIAVCEQEIFQKVVQKKYIDNVLVVDSLKKTESGKIIRDIAQYHGSWRQS